MNTKEYIANTQAHIDQRTNDLETAKKNFRTRKSELESDISKVIDKMVGEFLDREGFDWSDVDIDLSACLEVDSISSISGDTKYQCRTLKTNLNLIIEL